MVRRVKAYLKSMKVITDEDILHKMSLECEPPLGGIPTNPHPQPLHQPQVLTSSFGVMPKVGDLFWYTYCSYKVHTVPSLSLSLSLVLF